MLNVKSISAGYGKEIITDISLSVGNGELVGILGPNGCGKTTLIKSVSGVIKPKSGLVEVDGKNITNLSARKKALYISTLSQRLYAVSGFTASDIIETGLYARSGIFGKISDYEKGEIRKTALSLGIEKLLNRDYSKLSEGQRQMVNLAAVAVQNTPVVLLDEPDSALDFNNVNMLFERIESIVKESGKSAVAVLHNPALALERCSKIFIMKNGRIVAETKKNDPSLEDKLKFIYPEIKTIKAGGNRIFCCSEKQVTSYDKN